VSVEVAKQALLLAIRARPIPQVLFESDVGFHRIGGPSPEQLGHLVELLRFEGGAQARDVARVDREAAREIRAIARERVRQQIGQLLREIALEQGEDRLARVGGGVRRSTGGSWIPIASANDSTSAR
jgi:hypothetical protein